MKSAQTHGDLNDYAMTFTMNDQADRGWLWRDTSHTASGGAMSLSTRGSLAVSRGINTGGGETDTGWSDHPLHVFNSWQTGQNDSYNTVYIDADWSGTAAFSANRAQTALRVDLDNSKSNTTSVSGNRHSIIAISATSDSTGYTHDNRGLYGFAKSTGAGNGIGTQSVFGAYTYAQGYLSSGAANIYGLHSLAYRGGSTSGGTLYGVYTRALSTTDGSGKSGNAVGGYFEVECDEDTIEDAKGVFSHIDHDGGTITTGYLFYGSYNGTVGTKWGTYITGETQNYFSGNVGIGSAAPVAKLDVDGNIHCTKLSAGTQANPGSNLDICLGADNDTGFACPSDGVLEFWANNAEVAQFTSTGINFYEAIDSNQPIKTSAGLIECGEGGGSVALTINDGHGNANVTFNHAAGVPDQSGSSARIESPVDGTNAQMIFELKDSVTANTAVSMTNIMTLDIGVVSVTGSISATADITAYSSDRRLKENFRSIEDPIDKIKKLNGYVFDWNEKSAEVGFNPRRKKDEVGLIAQEVQDVIPQAVAPAPFDSELNHEGTELVSLSGENYLTVQYEKLVPLLIESIKEQQSQIDELRQEINNLKGDK